MITQYIVDAFTDRLFAGNPAAVCVLDAWLPERTMMAIAAENNLSETAFLVRAGGVSGDDASWVDACGGGAWRLRWFTPTVEVELCGHATLASAFVVMSFIEPDAEKVEFETLSGRLAVTRSDGWYEMDFPTYELADVPVTDEMEAAFGARPARAVQGLDLICVFDDEASVRAADPSDEDLVRLPGRMAHVTAPGAGGVDCVSRCFGPKLGVHEDPVCGSAHCQIADFWGRELGKDEILAYEASARGGYLRCRPLGGGRIQIAGQAVLFATSQLNVDVA